MKKNLVVLAALLIAAGSSAQTDSTTRMRNDADRPYTQHVNEYYHPDGYMYQYGKMMMVKDGKITPMEKSVTLSNGTIVMTNGSYALRDGTRYMFKEGEHMDLSGKMVPMDQRVNVQTSKNEKYADGYLFRNGKVMLIQNGKMTLVEKDVTLSNGTLIMHNGNYMVKGGKKIMLKDGEHMDMNGKVTMGSQSKIHDDKPSRENDRMMIPDSLKNNRN
jgi:hypothetical protein